MKFLAATSLLLASTQVSAFRDQSQKKAPHLIQNQQQRRLPQDEGCYVDMHTGESSSEIPVHVTSLPFTTGAGADYSALFKVKFQDATYSPNWITAYAWCIDLSRYISTGDYHMDIFGGYDPDIHTDAVDKPQNFPNLAWLINNVNVGDIWPAQDGCAGGEISWTELQGAVWRVIDDETDAGTWFGFSHEDCIAQQIAQKAMAEGTGYELDCSDPFEQMPLVMVSDLKVKGKDEIQHQVIMAEVPLMELEGYCECPTPAPTTAPKTPAPSVEPRTMPTGGKEPTPAPVPYVCSGSTETAFAYPEDGSGCFLDDGFSRWGWSIDFDGEMDGTYTMDVYAAAGQCDTDKGTVVGEVTVTYDKDEKTCTGEYNSIGGFAIMEFQFYCGAAEYPKNNGGKDTVAPGKYPCVNSEVATPGTYSVCTIDDVEGSTLHFIAHAVSCTDFSVTPAPTDAPTDPPVTPAPTDAPTVAPVTPGPTDAPTDPPVTPGPTDAPTDPPVTPGPTDAPTDPPVTPGPTDAPINVCEYPRSLDFDTDGDGNPTSAGDLAADLYSSLGITISSSTGAGKPPMLFDTANPTGGDNDLFSTEFGKVLIISEDGDQSDPDDNIGGTITVTFASPVCIETMGVLDFEEQSYVSLYDSDGNLIGGVRDAPTMDDGESAVMDLDACAVVKMEVQFGGSGAITDIEYCLDPSLTPAPTDAPTVAPVTPGPTDAPTDPPVTPGPTDAPTDPPVTPGPTDAPTDPPVTQEPTDDDPTPSPTGGPTTTPVTPAPTDAPTDPPVTPGPTDAPTDPPVTPAPTDAPTDPPVDPRTPAPQTPPPKTPAPTPAPTKGSGSGDPHFKTWTGDKYDYHGECDLVLVNNPSFMDGRGLRVHIRTTRIKYFSYIERIAVQIGNDVLEFANDVDNFMINGTVVEKAQKHHKTMLGGFWIRRDPKAISIRVHDEGRKHHDNQAAKIDLHTRKNGFPAVIVDGGITDVFRGSLGLLGDWATGKRLARDGKTELDGEDATAFALEWQVRDDEPMLFQEARAPQYPTVCTPPAKMMGSRLGMSHMQKEAEKACAHWKEDMEDCIFDVIATRDILVAEEGSALA